MIAVELGARYPSLPAAIIAVDPGSFDLLPQERRVFEAFVSQMDGPNGEGVRRAFVNGMFLPTDDADRCRWITDTMCSAPQPSAAAVIRGVLSWNGVGALLLCNASLLVLLDEPAGGNAPHRLRRSGRTSALG